MGRVAFAMLLLSLEIVGRASVSNAGEASPVSGVVLPSQLESGVTNASTCLNGNSTQGSCGGSPAGITYATTAQNWTQTISITLTGGTQTKVTLTPCPKGIDTTSGAGYQVLISGGGNSEAVKVVSGSCVSGTPSGTITFTPHYSYPAGTTIGSASSGIQETLNSACGVDATAWKNSQCNVTIPANGPGYPTHSLNTYNVYGTIFFHSNQSVLSGYGVSLNCLGRGPCLQVGDLVSANDNTNDTVAGISFRSPVVYPGVNITKAVRTTNVVTITTSTAHGFRPGDLVVNQFTDDSRYWGDARVATVPTSTTFTYASTGANIAIRATPGVTALAYEAVLDNGQNIHFPDITYDLVGEGGAFNNFFDFWDDENVTVDHFNNNAIPLYRGATWVGSFLYSAGNQNHTIAPVITLQNSTITANGSNGVTVYDSNGVYVKHTVIQAPGMWQIYTANTTGNFQGVSVADIYSEPNLSLNPTSPVYTPFNGTGVAGLIVGESASPASVEVAGQNPAGLFATGGTGATPLVYFVVANDTTARTQTSPMEILVWSSTGSDTPTLRWPRVANAADNITYDIIRSSFIPNAVSPASVYPSNGNCLGGSPTACGSVTGGLAITQATACTTNGGLLCTFTDSSPSANTNSYPINNGSYAGNLNFWPGSIVSENTPANTSTDVTNLVGIGLNGKPLVIAKQCTLQGATGPSGAYTICTTSPAVVGSGTGAGQTATLMMDHGGQAPGFVKGRLIFTSPGLGTAYHHIITLIDSNPLLTQSTWGFRPVASTGDVWIGTDSPLSTAMNAGNLAFGSPNAISNYINNTGDNSSWLERLTSKQKTFAVPVRISEGNSLTLGDGSPLSQMKIYSVPNMPAGRVPPQSCVDVVGEARGLTKSDQITSITPPGRLGNLSLNAYPADEGAILLHFCNPSVSESISPPGTYSFLAVR